MKVVACISCGCPVDSLVYADHLSRCQGAFNGPRTTGTVSDEPTPDNDPVNHPDHYTSGGVECIDAIQAALTG